MDLNMPIMDGYEATTHILALFQRKQQSLMQQPNFNSRVSQLSDLQQQQNPSRNGSANNHDGPNSNANSRSQGAGGAAAVLLPSKIHVVAVTAFQNDENIRLCYRVGMTDVMHKPISIDGMKRCLDQFYYNV
jgi:CheY-like chemotaxis protein